MNFLDAKRIVAEFSGGPELRLLLALSGTGEPLELFVKAAAAERGLTAKLRLLPFNTLQQALLTGLMERAATGIPLPKYVPREKLSAGRTWAPACAARAVSEDSSIWCVGWSAKAAGICAGR